jgi:2-C-methyl-D-erythritol 4-phosphate cytidylyltransferase
VVLAAAGSGKRLGAGGPKAIVEVAGRPLLAWSLDAFARSETVGSVVVALPEGTEAQLPDGVDRVAGGPTRSESVLNAIGAAPGAEVFVVHDAARPLVTAELIDELVDELVGRPDIDGVIAAAAITDTIKRAGEPTGDAASGSLTVASTESRDHLWAAQTPQVFRAEALRNALDVDPERLAAASDDAMLVEEAGGMILIHPAPPENLKVTTLTDLRLAELLLADRRRPD